MSTTDSFQIKDIYRFKWRDGKKNITWNRNQKKAGVAIRQMDFKTKNVRSNKEDHYIMMGWFQQEDITFVNIYAPNIEVPKYTKQIIIDIKGEMHSCAAIVGDFNTPTYISGWTIQTECQ